MTFTGWCDENVNVLVNSYAPTLEFDRYEEELLVLLSAPISHTTRLDIDRMLHSSHNASSQ